MPSQAQLDANRINSKKSTGPTSPEGKAVSSLNALKSGIDAESEIIKDEDPAGLEALSAAFLLEFHPTGGNQLSLVDALVAAEWIQRRLRRVEAHLWNYRLECLDQNLTHAQYIDDSFQHTGPLGHAYHDALDSFNRIHRRIDSTNRLYLRTLKALQDLQSVPTEPAKPVEPDQPPPPPDQPPPPPDQPPLPPARPLSSPAGGPVTPVSEAPFPVEAQQLIPPIGFVPHFANLTAKQPPVSHENRETPWLAINAESNSHCISPRVPPLLSVSAVKSRSPALKMPSNVPLCSSLPNSTGLRV